MADHRAETVPLAIALETVLLESHLATILQDINYEVLKDLLAYYGATPTDRTPSGLLIYTRERMVQALVRNIQSSKEKREVSNG